MCVFLALRKYQYVVVRAGTDADEMEIALLIPRTQITEYLRQIIHAIGLSIQRQKYLYKTVWLLVLQQHQDAICPPPLTVFYA